MGYVFRKSLNVLNLRKSGHSTQSTFNIAQLIGTVLYSHHRVLYQSVCPIMLYPHPSTIQLVILVDDIGQYSMAFAKQRIPQCYLTSFTLYGIILLCTYVYTPAVASFLNIMHAFPSLVAPSRLYRVNCYICLRQ